MEYTLKFKKRYNEYFKHNPIKSNIWLLFAELYDDAGKAEVISQEDLMKLLDIRFNDINEYQLPKENKEGDIT